MNWELRVYSLLTPPAHGTSYRKQSGCTQQLPPEINAHFTLAHPPPCHQQLQGLLRLPPGPAGPSLPRALPTSSYTPVPNFTAVIP